MRRAGSTLPGDLLVVVSLAIALFWILINKQMMERHSHCGDGVWVGCWGRRC
jgi:hypothetical protein